MAAKVVGIIGYGVGVADGRTGAPATVHSAVISTYVKAVRAAGGLPVVVPVLDVADVPGVVGAFDALVITGGTDVDPARYGAERDSRTLEADHDRDTVELAVARAAVDADHPLLAICRGVQVLNVALGGTLTQHVDDHMHMDRYNLDVHDVTVEAGSRLAGIVGATCIATNSLHHQAIAAVGPGARAVAWAPDGTIEAIEVERAPRVIGVQWHPEMQRHRPEHLALFAALLS